MAWVTGEGIKPDYSNAPSGPLSSPTFDNTGTVHGAICYNHFNSFGGGGAGSEILKDTA